MIYAVAGMILIASALTALSVRGYLKYIQLRFRLFELRDRILMLGINGPVSRDFAAHSYNLLNWPLRHLRVFPVFFCMSSLAYAFERLEVSREHLESMPLELKAWYRDLGQLTLEAIRTYTPFGMMFDAKRPNKFAFTVFVIWLLLKMLRYVKHPLMRSEFGGVNYERARQESEAMIRTTKFAQGFTDSGLAAT